MSFVLRKPNSKDLDDILKIEKETYKNHHWSYKTFESEFKSDYSYYLVFENIDSVSKIIIGYTGFWKVLEEGHITTLVVNPKFRNLNIADILLYNLICKAINLGIKWLTLEVRVSNHKAINLYSKYKFKKIGIRTNYYQDNKEDALLLWSTKLDTPEYANHLKGEYIQVAKKNSTTDIFQYIDRT